MPRPFSSEAMAASVSAPVADFGGFELIVRLKQHPQPSIRFRVSRILTYPTPRALDCRDTKGERSRRQLREIGGLILAVERGASRDQQPEYDPPWQAHGTSECQPGDELQLPRRRGAGDPPDGRSRNIGTGICEVRMIERVKELEAVLKSEPLSQFCVLGQREIPVLNARSVEETPSDIPEGTCRSNRKRGRVKPPADCPLVWW